MTSRITYCDVDREFVV